MSTATPPDFEAYNDIFTSLIDSIIPAGFGVSKNGGSSTTPVETADEIVERNKALRKAERHRKIISNGTATPPSSTSSLISASNIPLANALKRRAPDGSEPKPTPATNGGPSPTQVQDDDDDDEEESRTRVVSKKSKLSRDVFSTKKQNAKVKTKPNGVAGAKQSNSNGVAGVNGKEQDDGETPTLPPKHPEPASISSYNPFKLPTDSSSTQAFSSPLPGMQTIFSSQPSPPKLLAPQAAAPPSLPPSPPRQRTGTTPPPELHGKERKRWRKKMKKATANAAANTAELET